MTKAATQKEDDHYFDDNGDKHNKFKKNGKLTTSFYESELGRMQEELVKLQYWVRKRGSKSP